MSRLGSHSRSFFWRFWKAFVRTPLTSLLQRSTCFTSTFFINGVWLLWFFDNLQTWLAQTLWQIWRTLRVFWLGFPQISVLELFLERSLLCSYLLMHFFHLHSFLFLDPHFFLEDLFLSIRYFQINFFGRGLMFLENQCKALKYILPIIFSGGSKKQLIVQPHSVGFGKLCFWPNWLAVLVVDENCDHLRLMLLRILEVCQP